MADAPDTTRRPWKIRLRSLIVLGLVAALVLMSFVIFQLATRDAPQTAQPKTREEAIEQLSQSARNGAVGGDEALELARMLSQDAFADPDAIATARGAFADAAATLLQDPDKRVRAAVLQAARPGGRKQGLEAMSRIARDGGAAAAPLWRATGALMLEDGDDRAVLALENARTLNPQDKTMWRMLGFAYARAQREKEATGAALVAEGLDAAAANRWTTAVVKFENALALATDAQTRAFVLGQIGDAEAARENWGGAEKSYRAALLLHGAQKNIAAISLESSKLARAQLKQGEAGRACATLDAARAQGATVTDEERAIACRSAGR